MNEDDEQPVHRTIDEHLTMFEKKGYVCYGLGFREQLESISHQPTGVGLVFYIIPTTTDKPTKLLSSFPVAVRISQDTTHSVNDE